MNGSCEQVHEAVSAKQIPGTRDNYLDFIRGIAAIAVIGIHTTFWSGYDYTPEIAKSLSLAVDVPLFFFISGMAGSYVRSFARSIKSLLTIFKRYLIFLTFFVLLLAAVGLVRGEWQGFNLSNLYHAVFFIRQEPTSLPVVVSSMWFMPVYCAVVPIGSCVLSYLWRTAGPDEKQYTKLCRAAAVIGLLGLLYTYVGGTFFHISSRILFYLFFYLLGAACRNVRIKSTLFVTVFIALDVLAMKGIGVYFGWNISDMQSMKFPPNIVYLLYSLVVIVIALRGRAMLPSVSANNPFCKIGRSALLFYFCQGIAGSVLYWFLPYIHLQWYIKLPIAFIANVALTFCFVIVLSKYYQLADYTAAKIKAVLLPKIQGQTRGA